MLNRRYILVSFLFFIHYIVISQTSRREINFQNDWFFKEGEVKNAFMDCIDTSNWRVLNLPHDWSIEGDYSKNNLSGGLCGYLPTGVVWYKKEFNLSKKDLSLNHFLEFDAVYMNSTVWINEKKVGIHPYGYNTFFFDISKNIQEGKNSITIKIDNTDQPSSRWYTGTGIFGGVKLVSVNKSHIKRRSVFFKTVSSNNEKAKLSVSFSTKSCANNKVYVELLDDQNNTVSSVHGSILEGKFFKEFDILSPKLWSTQNPNLYTLHITLRENKKIIDEINVQVGIRSLLFDRKKGFFLNGVPTKLKGVCEHHDGGPLGGAFPEKILKERLLLLKNMGCNAIRTAHNPRTQGFYKLCNELGIMVLDEVFDGWHKKAAADYGARFFDKWWKKDVEEWVKTNRNNPSIIMYSVGNETGKEDIHNISKLIKKFDKTRPTTGGTVFKGVDIQGYNGPGGVPGAMQEFHEQYPNELCVRTEVPHTLQTRGFYRVKTWWRQNNIERNLIPEYGEEQIFFDGHPRFSSSYDNAGVRISARTSWRETRDMPWIIGEFRWTGFDYLGEASFSGGKWPARIWNFGVIDLAGIPKDHYYFYQSQWTEKPMVHVLPHWTHRFLKEGTIVPVVAYSNCDEVELFLNGKSLGKKSEDKELLEFVWKVPYQSGILRAVGYNKNVKVAEKVWNTANSPTQLYLETNNSNLQSNEIDTATLSFSAHDNAGNLVPWTMNKVNFKFDDKKLKHLGFENGNPIDVTNHRKRYRNLFYGKAKGFFQATDINEDIEIVATAILGDTLFEAEEQLAIDFKRVALRGSLIDADFSIKYSTDQRDPIEGTLYTNPFNIDKTTLVKAVLLKNAKPYMYFEELFTKGEKPKVTDPRWQRNKSKKNDFTFSGPFDKQILGKWKLGNKIFEFKKNGKLYLEHLYGSSPRGYWWYDYPNDVFEADGDSGSGQIIWTEDKKKEKLKIKLLSSNHQKLQLLQSDGSIKILKKIKDNSNKDE